MKETKVCMCECHKDGDSITHMFDCCDLCYEKYIDVSGNIDINRLSEAFNRIHNGIFTFKRCGDDIYWLHN